jgi:chemotaxis protein MotB
MGKKKKDDGPAGAPAWLVTYGDLMSLLLTFFVLLLSFSTIQEENFKEALMSLRGAFGLMPKELTLVQINPQPKNQRPSHKSVEELARKLRRRLQVQGKLDKVKIEFDQEGGLKINLPSQILFDAGSTDLRADAYPVLNDIAELFGEMPEAFFQVRGHTDSQPFAKAGTSRDNYDLSYTRADRVARYLTRNVRVVLDRFEIVACGSGQPIAPNTTEAGRRANRRVEIHVRGMFTDVRLDEIRSRFDTTPAPPRSSGSSGEPGTTR